MYVLKIKTFLTKIKYNIHIIFLTFALIFVRVLNGEMMGQRLVIKVDDFE